ncbi:MAG: hypothetical protein IMW89_20410 [Ktedonobacteraceae bacterium]|nr:hypothetical protein [Ktedonobacteraceae bacterium]
MSDEPNQPQQPPPVQPYGPYGPQPQMSYGPPYGPPPLYAPPPQPKQSKRWLWITLSVIGGIVLLSCIGCTIAFGQFVSPIAGPVITVSAYYASIQQQDYAKAYSYLDTNEATIKGQQITSQDAFTKLAQNADATEGKVTAISSGSGFQPPLGSTTARMTLEITRGSKTYPVTLQLKKIGNDWKISSADAI